MKLNIEAKSLPGSHLTPAPDPQPHLTLAPPLTVTLCPGPPVMSMSPVTMSRSRHGARRLRDQWLAPGSHMTLAPAH